MVVYGFSPGFEYPDKAMGRMFIEGKSFRDAFSDLVTCDQQTSPQDMDVMGVMGLLTDNNFPRIRSLKLAVELAVLRLINTSNYYEI